MGANYWSYQPHAGVLWTNGDWEATGKFMYNINATNAATQYKSGQNFHFDSVAGKHLRRWALGAAGYFLKQTTDDTVAGQVVPAAAGLYDTGRRGQVFAVGPSVKYETKSHIGICAQWGHETLVRNRFGGDKLVLRLVIPAASLKVPRI